MTYQAARRRPTDGMRDRPLAIKREDRGVLVLVLHAHMPYVEGFGTWPFGEDWLFEAIATVYLPLLQLTAGEAVTVGLTPVLCDQLETLTGETGSRFELYLDASIDRHFREASTFEQAGEPRIALELRRAAGDYIAARDSFRSLDGDLLSAWREASKARRPSLMASAATHALLPLLPTRAGVQLQLAVGLRAHQRRFGAWSGTFWLPECGYSETLEGLLASSGVRAFFVDQTEQFGYGSLDQLEPIRTASGSTAIPVDWQSVALVWDEQHGYPTASAYRDHHTRRTLHGLKPWNYAGGIYDRERADLLAREHARHFVGRVAARLEQYARERDRPGLVCCAFDAELFGHWWYEGIEWLRAVLGEVRRQGIELATVPEALDRIPDHQRAIGSSTWSVTKDFSSWEGPRVHGLRDRARSAERRLIAAARAGTASDRSRLLRATRELLALQSSDWAFLAGRGTAGAYPVERTCDHAAALDEALAAGGGGAARLSPRVRNLAPDLDLTMLASAQS